MAVPKVLLISEIVGYMIGVVLSLFMIATAVVNFKKFKAHCFLFSHGEWDNDDQLQVTWASKAYCISIISAGVLMLLVCCIQLYRLAISWLLRTHSTFLASFIEAAVCTTLAALTMYCAVTVTLGFMTWCEDMNERYPTCLDADGEKLDKRDDIDTTNFYSDMTTLQVTSWIAFVTWTTLTVFSMAKMCYIHYWRNLPMSVRGEEQPLLD